MTENQVGRAPARAKIGSQLATLAQACFRVSVPAVGPDLVTILVLALFSSCSANWAKDFETIKLKQVSMDNPDASVTS